MSYVIVLLVLAIGVTVISGPLRARHEMADEGRLADVAELEAARDAKYSEIRDAELDLRTGKLSEEDYSAVNGSLRAEAVDILHRLDETEQA
jgi:type II secretory pathway component PulM